MPFGSDGTTGGEEHQAGEKGEDRNAGSPRRNRREASYKAAVEKVLNAEDGEGNGEEYASEFGKRIHVDVVLARGAAFVAEPRTECSAAGVDVELGILSGGEVLHEVV